MSRTLVALVAGAAICAAGLLSAASAQESKKSEKAEIPGGIEATIKAVDKEKGTVSILVTEGAKTRTFTVTDETTIVGARGGKVRKRLNDRRFREGLDITVVPAGTGTTAKELHLGIYRPESGEAAAKPKAELAKPKAELAKPKTELAKAVAKKRMNRKEREDAEADLAKANSKKATSKAAVTEDDDEDDEIAGKVKSYNTDSGRHVLVVTLLNGKGRVFFLGKEVKVLVKGKPVKDGLMDSAIKEGASVTVLTEPGGHKVKELHLEPAVAAAAPTKTKKAG
jgi:hypothetical protein